MELLEKFSIRAKNPHFYEKAFFNGFYSHKKNLGEVFENWNF